MDEVHYQIINPKSITMGQLYGEFDPVSRVVDGILAIGYRNFSTTRQRRKTKGMFDGPVDAVWIENMNTVLDNNKKLCLMNGEVIMMSDSMSMILSLWTSGGDPATVSRVGVIYMEPHRMGWQPCVQSWLERLQKEPHDPDSEIACPPENVHGIYLLTRVSCLVICLIGWLIHLFALSGACAKNLHPQTLVTYTCL